MLCWLFGVIICVDLHMRLADVAVPIAFFRHSVVSRYKYVSGQKVVFGGCPCIELIKIVMFGDLCIKYVRGLS